MMYSLLAAALLSGSAAFPNTVPRLDQQSADTVPPLIGPTLRYGMDTTMSPCTDFYQYVNGGWRAQADLGPVSPGLSKSITTLGDVHQRIQLRLRALVDSAYTIRNTVSDPTLRAIGTFYHSCMIADSSALVSEVGMVPRRQAMPDRKLLCFNKTFQTLSFAIGQAFARDLLTPEATSKMETLLDHLQQAAIQRVQSNTWMTGEERANAAERLTKLRLRIGMPKEIIDFDSLNLTSDYSQNLTHIRRFVDSRWLASIGADQRDRWRTSLTRTNAFYSPAEHSVEVPAAMFMPPFFDVNQDHSLNYAGIGIVIGHEIFHSIAQSLSSFESTELKDNIHRFKKANSQFPSLDNWAVDGNRTFQEDIADLGGVLVAYDAWKNASNSGNESSPQTIDGYTPDQRFFIGTARVWRAKWKGFGLSKGVHAAPFARVYTMIMHSPQFAPAFGCKEEDPMILDKQYRVTIW